MTNWMPYLVFGSLTLVVFGGIIWGVASNKTFLGSSLDDIATSRGLITFLVAIVTVAIALRIPTLLTVAFGVFGTRFGWYPERVMGQGSTRLIGSWGWQL